MRSSVRVASQRTICQSVVGCIGGCVEERDRSVCKYCGGAAAPGWEGICKAQACLDASDVQLAAWIKAENAKYVIQHSLQDPADLEELHRSERLDRLHARLAAVRAQRSTPQVAHEGIERQLNQLRFAHARIADALELIARRLEAK